MAYDQKNLRRAKRRYEELVAAHENDLIRRRQRVREEIPRLGEIDRELRSTVIGAINAALHHGDDAETRILAIKDVNLELQREQAEILTMNGYPFNYLADVPMCEECEDTGFVGKKMCSCLAKLYEEEQKKELAKSIDIAYSTFDHFVFSYYSDVPDPRFGVSARDNIGYIFDTCNDFARSFGRHSDNLLMQGSSGLGKTFLAGCIANVVVESGFSVLYESACSLFARIDADRFRREEDETGIDIERYLNCDLLILDDLGTESMTNYGMTMLYRLINTRKTNKKQCVVITGLSQDELRRRYGPQIASRLEGDYTALRFFGEDVRKLTK